MWSTLAWLLDDADGYGDDSRAVEDGFVVTFEPAGWRLLVLAQLDAVVVAVGEAGRIVSSSTPGISDFRSWSPPPCSGVPSPR